MQRFKEITFWVLDFIAALLSWLLLGIIIPNWNIVIKELEENFRKK